MKINKFKKVGKPMWKAKRKLELSKIEIERLMS